MFPKWFLPRCGGGIKLMVNACVSMGVLFMLV